MRIERVDDIQDVTCPVLRERLNQGQSLGMEDFVALVDGREAGLLMFEHFARHSMGQVHEIYVLNVFRRNGVGQRLLSYSEGVARQHGYLKLRLMARSLDPTRIGDRDLTAWYRNHGFKSDSPASMWMQKELLFSDEASSGRD